MNGSSRFMVARDRAALVAGLRELADFLAAHPDVPAPRDVKATVFTRGEDDDDAADRAAVDQVAAEVGMTARDGVHHAADRCFGPVRYQVVHVSARATRDHQACNSYADVVRVDEPDVSDGPEEVDR